MIREALPVRSPESGPAEMHRAANCSAAQQVIPSLMEHASLPGCQKPDGFIYCLGVLITPKNLANSVGVGSESVNDIRVGNALQAHHMGCNSLGERECASLQCDDVHFDTCDRVSFVWGSFPKQISHWLTSNMAGGTALGRSGVLPAVRWFRTLRKGAGSSAGVATANRHPSIQSFGYVVAAGQPSPWGDNRKYLWMNCGCGQYVVDLLTELLGPLGGARGCVVSAPLPDLPIFSEFASCWRQFGVVGATPTSCEFAAGGGLGCARGHADRGQACLQAAPNTSPRCLGRAALAARLFSAGVCDA